MLRKFRSICMTDMRREWYAAPFKNSLRSCGMRSKIFRVIERTVAGQDFGALSTCGFYVILLCGSRIVISRVQLYTCSNRNCQYRYFILFRRLKITVRTCRANFRDWTRVPWWTFCILYSSVSYQKSRTYTNCELWGKIIDLFTDEFWDPSAHVADSRKYIWRTSRRLSCTFLIAILICKGNERVYFAEMDIYRYTADTATYMNS